MTNEALKRIDPLAIPGLFRRLDIKPVRQNWGGRNCGCILVALHGGRSDRATALATGVACDQSIAPNLSLVEWMAHLTGLNRDYACGLMEGWDEYKHASLDSEAYVLGRLDGRAAAVACGLIPEGVAT